MPSTIITSSTRPSSCSIEHSGSVPYDREHREYGATKHSSTSTRCGNVIIHNHNKGIEEGSAPSPSYASSRSRY
ncbi:hypothetical protein VUR80DRAFT_3754 [Thermomyces stellatus]